MIYPMDATLDWAAMVGEWMDTRWNLEHEVKWSWARQTVLVGRIVELVDVTLD